MFSKNDSSKSKTEAATPQQEPTRVKNTAPPSIISANLAIKGNLTTSGEVQIDGKVDGDVNAGAVTIGAEASVNGEIQAERVVVHGALQGCIRADTVQLAKSAKVQGDIIHRTLSMEAGAILDGHCKHSEKPREKAAASAPAPSSGPAKPTPVPAAGGGKAAS